MNKNPYFSIVMPNYNHGHLIRESIESVMKQDFEDWELIIVDNNSTDDSKLIIKSFKDSRIKFFSTENKGVIAKSRNLGIKNSKGEWIAFLDSDDLWYKNKLSSLECLTKKQYDIICSNEYRVNKRFKKKIAVRYGIKTQDPYNELLLKGNRLSTSATIVNKKFLEKKNILFDENKNFITVEDYGLWLQLALNKAKFCFCDKFLGEYRIHKDNNSRRYNIHRRNLEALLRIHIFSNNILPKNQIKFWLKVNSALILMDLKELSNQANIFKFLRAFLKIIISSSLKQLFYLTTHVLSKFKLK
jgi:glycosyltransferase involved in cell wall biosynthesis